MKRLFRTFPILSLASLLFFSACQSATPRVETQGEYSLQITQIDTSNFPLVNVYVSVRDIKGEPAVINAEKIQLLENGQPVPKQDVQGLGEGGPLTSMLVIDS